MEKHFHPIPTDMVHLRKDWIVHEELFLQNVKWLEVLAVRGSFGIQGNVNEEQIPDMILTMGGMDNISEEYLVHAIQGSQ
ncbi:MAG: hypothetical protein V8R91_20310 [Butyricimonas faecihominis]